MYCISRAVTSKPLYYRINLTLAYLIFHGKERHDIRNFSPLLRMYSYSEYKSINLQSSGLNPILSNLFNNSLLKFNISNTVIIKLFSYFCNANHLFIT